MPTVETNENCKYVPVDDFYAGKSVFITGGTGFLGKVFIEKLLYSCAHVDKVYVLVRMKKNHNSDQRIQQMIDNPLFTRLKEKRPDDFKKIVPIVGDVTSPNLGISVEDEHTLLEKVSVVFHTAATIKFNEPLKVALDVNVEGTKRVLELCHRMKNIQAFIHMSTAYSNTNREVIEEIIYPPPARLSDVYKFVDQHDDEAKILNDRPNTYTFTKALAESYVLENHGDIPTAIVRPSIVTSIKGDPLTGWLDNYNGPTGLLLSCAKGLHRAMLGNGRYIADMVPVDYVSNLTIVAAARCKKSDDVNVYNCCTSSTNPITWAELVHQFCEGCKKIGIGGIYPKLMFFKTMWTVTLLQFFLQTIPAFMIDFCRIISGKRPRYTQIQSRLLFHSNQVQFFTNHSWIMDVKRARALFSSLSMEDRQRFPFDPQEIHWETYILSYCNGVKRYLLSNSSSKV